MIAPGLTQAELARLLGRVEARIFRQLVVALARVKAGMPLSLVERALLERNLDAAIEAIGLAPFHNVVAQVREDLVPIREAAWNREAMELEAVLVRRRQPVASLQVSLGAHQVQNPESLAALERQSLSRIREISRETEQAIRTTIQRSITQGLHPTQAARQLRSVIGLNQRQAQALAAFRSKLATQDRDLAQVERMAARFAQRQATLRAENIARTETMTALNEGKSLQRERLVREGVIEHDDWEQEWVTADDERTCPICLPLDGARAPIGGLFDAGTGAYRGPPVHPRCRCTTRTVLRGFRTGASTPRQLRRA